ncbi:hypothetical protein [Burkholderia plantarii]|uniref:hypothetical protein n=1 Tax=Burkholderia plantarii TaxID=41899 RepID=UPI0011E00CFF|nr:hypothetical protein [Burkholderia plantarii]
MIEQRVQFMRHRVRREPAALDSCSKCSMRSSVSSMLVESIAGRKAQTAAGARRNLPCSGTEWFAVCRQGLLGNNNRRCAESFELNGRQAFFLSAPKTNMRITQGSSERLTTPALLSALAILPIFI